MFFKPQSLIRPGLWKSATQGYAQSLVAGYQSSSQNTPFHNLQNNVVNYFHRPGPSHQQHALPPQHLSGAGAKANADVSGSDKGLDAYYAAWQKHYRPEEKERHQFQFAKRLGWRAPTTIPENQTQPEEAREQSSRQELADPTLIPRARSTSAIDDVKRSQRDASATIESALADDAIAQEIDRVNSETKATASRASEIQDESTGESLATSESFISTSPSSLETPSHSTPASSVSEVEVYSQNLTTLAQSQRYAEIPAVFEAMLLAGVQPSASAYNALLLAAINLPRGKHQIVPKVLDVYFDMLRRRVLPETSTYSILLELLATRALDVMTTKKELEEKRVRYSKMEQHGQFMFRSDETEAKILAEDDSLDLAVRLFDTSAAVAARHVYSLETYQLLICACAEAGRIGDMVRIYADMESQGLRASSTMFAPMIRAFAAAGDLRSAVECYDEYKTLAIAHDNGEISITRKDEDVYAAVVKAYANCGRLTGGLKFLGKVEDTLEDTERLLAMRDVVSLQSLHPVWLQEDRHLEALEHANTKLSQAAREQAVASICIDAADKNKSEIATQAFDTLDQQFSVKPATAMVAMHVRNGDIAAADAARQKLEVASPSLALVEPTTMYTVSLINSGNVDSSLQQCRLAFSRIRDSTESHARLDITERIAEALEVICQSVLRRTIAPSVAATMELIWMMTENGGLIAPLEALLAGFGPEDVAQLAWNDLNLLTQVQAGMLVSHGSQDVAHAARFAHLVDMIVSSGLTPEQRTSKMVEQALAKLDRPDLTMRWQTRQCAAEMVSPVQFSAVYQPAPPPSSAYEDMYDPYGSSTDFKGSAMIAEELEKTYGRHASHLNEALTKFRNMRRAGRHPRYATYAKLITAAAKENRVSLATEILAMARQDVPLVSNSRVVRHGWISILDAMVGACLTTGKRDMAAQHHQDLTAMGAAPSANTFGLYITTLKESTKTFDEATEAVKIFHRAKSEGVEPSSFLYNALIGKLGKARRIDDCLFYFAEMRSLGIRPTSVTYGTVVNALCRVSDDKFAEELFEEMESMSNYKPRPAPYNSLMQYFLTTKRDRSKVLAYYNRMKANRIQPTMHTYKLLIDSYATLDPVDMGAAEVVLDEIRASGAAPEAVHYASLIHAKGCVLHDVDGARKVFDTVISEGRIPPQASLYQALFEAMVANHQIDAIEPLLQTMSEHRVAMTPYIANTLIHGWATENIDKARAVFDSLGREKREPSTYEAMTRAYLAVEDHGHAMGVVGEALRRGYPSAVANRICELVGGGSRPTAPA